MGAQLFEGLFLPCLPNYQSASSICSWWQPFSLYLTATFLRSYIWLTTSAPSSLLISFLALLHLLCFLGYDCSPVLTILIVLLSLDSFLAQAKSFTCSLICVKAFYCSISCVSLFLIWAAATNYWIDLGQRGGDLTRNGHTSMRKLRKNVIVS